jgi:aliphatic nitrilase
MERILRDSPRGVSLIVGPMGAVIGRELQNEEGILYADIDLEQTVAPRQLQDVAGYYNRFDVFRLTVDRTPNKPAWFEGDGTRAEPAASAETEEAPRLAAAK